MKSPVPCMSGHAGNKVAACFPAVIDAATSGGSVPGRAICHSDDVQVVAAPHHGFGKAGGTAGVEEDEVVAGRFVRRQL